MAKIRPIVRGFGPVAPGGGAVVGAGLQAVGQAVGEFADLGTNRELLDIREQAQVDALEFKQFEKMERSEAMVQIITKQIARNSESSRIIAEDRDARNFDETQKKIDAFENDYNQALFEDRSNEFQDIFLSLDQPRRLGNINKTGTAVEAGRLRIITDNFQLTVKGIVETVDASTPPEQIAEDFRDMGQFGRSLGMKAALVATTVGQGERAAFDKLVGSVSVIEGLSLLSNKDVANAYTDKELQIRKRDQINKVNTVSNNREIVNASLELSTGIDALTAFNNGDTQADIFSMIESNNLPETSERDISDFVDSLFITKEKGPVKISARELSDIHSFSEESMGLIMDKVKIIEDRDDLSPEQKFDSLFELSRDAMTIFKEAVTLHAEGKFTTKALNGIRFQMWPLTAKLKSIESTAQREGIFAPILDAIFGPNKPEAPNNLLANRRRQMMLGQGIFSQLTQDQRSAISAFMTDESLTTDRAGEAMSVEEANIIANEMETRAFSKFFATGQGLTEDQAKERTSLFLNNSDPATEPIQQPQAGGVGGLVNQINAAIAAGSTREEIIKAGRDSPGSDPVTFDRALAIVDQNTIAVPDERVEPQPDEPLVLPELTAEDAVQAIREADPELSEKEAVDFLETMSKITTKIDPFILIGRLRGPIRRAIFGQDEVQ